MNKDAYYFPHFSNARTDRKLRRVRKELGIEGYGIYFMTLEVLRDQEDFSYPIEDIDLLADDFGTQEAKVEAVVKAYGLFKIDSDNFFFSPKLIEYLKPYLERSKRARKAALKRWHGDSNANALPEHSNSNASKVKESKVKESKVKDTGKQVASVPALSDVKDYFNEKGYDDSLAERFFEYYNEPMKDRNGRVWKDQHGRTVKSWKQKAIAVWMRKNNKSEIDEVTDELFS